jgi:hypothetical protein
VQNFPHEVSVELILNGYRFPEVRGGPAVRRLPRQQPSGPCPPGGQPLGPAACRRPGPTHTHRLIGQCAPIAACPPARPPARQVRTGKITERWRDKKWNMKIQFLTHGYNKELSKFNLFAIKELQCPEPDLVRVHILASKDMAGGARAGRAGGLPACRAAAAAWPDRLAAAPRCLGRCLRSHPTPTPTPTPTPSPAVDLDGDYDEKPSRRRISHSAAGVGTPGDGSAAAGSMDGLGQEGLGGGQGERRPGRCALAMPASRCCAGAPAGCGRLPCLSAAHQQGAGGPSRCTPHADLRPAPPAARRADDGAQRAQAAPHQDRGRGRRPGGHGGAGGG